MDVMKMDIPQGYICRLVQAKKQCTINVHEEKFAHSFLPCLYIAWMIKGRVKMLLDELKKGDKLDENTNDDWIENSVDFAPDQTRSTLPNTC